MPTYPYGIAASGIHDIFQGTTFSPNDVVKGIRDNYSPVNRTTLLNSIGYQVGLIQNYVNSSYLGRSDVPVQNAYVASGWFENLISLSGTISNSTAHEYSWINETGICVFKQTRTGSVCGAGIICGYGVSIYPEKIELFQYSTYDGDDWSGCWNRSGIFSDNLSFENSMIGGGYVATVKANKSHKFVIANPSTSEDESTYSGLLELYGSNIYLKSSKIYLSSTISPISNNYLVFCGKHLTISGSYPDGNILLTSNLIPLADGEKVIGDNTRYFKTGYIQLLDSVSQLTGAPGGSVGYYTTLGGVCGTSFITGTNGLYIQADYVCGSYLHNKTLVTANKIALYQHQTGIAPMSGYFQIMSGQLEFYSYNHGSGWILTNFA